MALNIRETGFTASGARPVVDETLARGVEVAAPLVEQRVTDFAVNQGVKAKTRLEDSLARTGSYIQGLREQQAELGQVDPADEEAVAAASALEGEISKVLAGQAQGFLTTPAAEARLATKVRELSRSFPTAAADLRGLVSGSGGDLFRSAQMSALASEEQSFERVNTQIDSDMVAAGFQPAAIRNPVLRQNWLRLTNERAVLQQQADISKARAELLKGRLDVAAAEKDELNGTVFRNTMSLMTGDIDKLLASAERSPEGGFTNSQEVLAAATNIAQQYKSAFLNTADPAADISSLLSTFDNYLATVRQSVTDGSAVTIMENIRDLMQTRSQLDFARLAPEAHYVATNLGDRAASEYMMLAASNPSSPQVQMFRSLYGMDRLFGNRAPDPSNPETPEDASFWTGFMNMLGTGPKDSEQAGALVNMLPPAHSSRFLGPAGAKFVDQAPEEFKNYFQRELNALSALPEVQDIAELGYSYQYDPRSKTLVVLDSDNQRVQDYTLGASADTRRGRRSASATDALKRDQFLSRFPAVTTRTRRDVRDLRESRLSSSVLKRITEQQELMNRFSSRVPVTAEEYRNSLFIRAQ